MDWGLGRSVRKTTIADSSGSLLVQAMKLHAKAVKWTARVAALLYAGWAAFHFKVAWDIMFGSV